MLGSPGGGAPDVRDFSAGPGRIAGWRRAQAARDGLFYNFGVLRDDYSRKAAFARLRGLIAELGRPAAR